MPCECKIGPGKFEGESAITFLAYEHMLNGCSDVTTGDGESEPCVDWIRAPLNVESWSESIALALQYGYCESCIKSAADGIEGGVAVWESEQGFVYSETFSTREEFDKALAEAEDSASEEDEEENL